jgi:hypothetical protein
MYTHKHYNSLICNLRVMWLNGEQAIVGRIMSVLVIGGLTTTEGGDGP